MALTDATRQRQDPRDEIFRLGVLEARSAEHQIRITDRGARVGKRVVDLVIGTVLLILTSPLLALLCTAVRATSPGPAIFKQERVGRDGRTFKVLKLRSMHAAAEMQLATDTALRSLYVSYGYKLPPGTDPRVTRLGQWLRSTSLDELPQLICVVKGEMSLVGPRPVVPEELHTLYGEFSGIYTSSRPGLTGLWQTSGRSTLKPRSRQQLDIAYARNWSIWLDIKILLRTIPSVMSRHGAH